MVLILGSGRIFKEAGIPEKAYTMRRFLLALIVASWSALAFAQLPPVGDLVVRFAPSSRAIAVGDSIQFHAMRFAMQMQFWDSEHEVRKIAGSEPDSFLVLVSAHPTNQPAPTIAGYDGPSFHIVPREPGVYVIRFDSTSAFQAGMGDAATFTALPATALRRASPRAEVGRDRSFDRYLLNGKRRKERAPKAR